MNRIWSVLQPPTGASVRRLLASLLTLCAAASVARSGGNVPDTHASEDQPEPALTVRADLDGDGRDDVFVVAANPEPSGVTLRLFSGAGETTGRPLAEARLSIEGTPVDLEATPPDMVTLTGCTGCGANLSTEESFSIAYRGGGLVLSAYRRSWDLNRPLSSGEVETRIGSCSIDFRTGKASASQDLDDEQPVPERYTAIAIADWSEDRRPPICIEPDGRQ
jgi:hypothetical protein